MFIFVIWRCSDFCYCSFGWLLQGYVCGFASEPVGESVYLLFHRCLLSCPGRRRSIQICLQALSNKKCWWRLRSSGPLIFISALLLVGLDLLLLLFLIVVLQFLLTKSSLLARLAIPTNDHCRLPLHHLRLALPSRLTFWIRLSVFSGSLSPASYALLALMPALPAIFDFDFDVFTFACSPLSSCISGSSGMFQVAVSCAFPSYFDFSGLSASFLIALQPVPASLASAHEFSRPPSPLSSPAVVFPADSSSRSVVTHSPVHLVLKFSCSHAASVVHPVHLLSGSDSSHHHLYQDWYLLSVPSDSGSTRHSCLCSWPVYSEWDTARSGASGGLCSSGSHSDASYVVEVEVPFGLL